ncbi:MAG TPA: hypothetical protein VN721_00140 [Flavipsychrobacter sp.]|nr:hypothetical protein [Flavipsychrobacter sp.]
MKSPYTLLFLFLFILLAGCNLFLYDKPAPIKTAFSSAVFNFSISPQDSVLHVGDTITFSAAIGNKFGDTVLTNGLVNLGFLLGGSYHIPKDSIDDFFSAYNGKQYVFISEVGNPYYSPGPVAGSLEYYTTNLEADSFRMKFRLVMLKRGLYQFQVHGGILTSSQGETGVDGNFTPQDHHWHFFQVPGVDTPKYGTQDYRENYLFAVE